MKHKVKNFVSKKENLSEIKIKMTKSRVRVTVHLNFGHHVIQILSNGEHPRENRPMKLLDFF